jgi:ferredoxin-NADP reductase
LWRPGQTKPIQLIAGGSGIVPFMAMIRSRASVGSSAPFRLLYSVREPAAVFYGDELRTLADRGIVRITQAYTRAVHQDWPLPPGRINADLIANATCPSTLCPTCYICGPTSFVESAAEFLSMNGHNAQKKSEPSASGRQEIDDEPLSFIFEGNPEKNFR